MRDVDDDAVGSRPFHLEIGVAAGRHRRIDMILRGQPLRFGVFQLFASLVEIVDLEAEMVDAVEIWSMRADIGRRVGLVVEDRDIDVAVGQEHRAVRAAAQFLQAKRRFVELGDLCRLLCRQGDMFDACHDFLPYCCRGVSLLIPLIARQTRSGVAGISIWVTPHSDSASTTALMTTPNAGVVPPSPAGRMPSGCVGLGTSDNSVSKNGTMSAFGIASSINEPDTTCAVPAS